MATMWREDKEVFSFLFCREKIIGLGFLDSSRVECAFVVVRRGWKGGRHDDVLYVCG